MLVKEYKEGQRFVADFGAKGIDDIRIKEISIDKKYIDIFGGGLGWISMEKFKKDVEPHILAQLKDAKDDD